MGSLLDIVLFLSILAFIGYIEYGFLRFFLKVDYKAHSVFYNLIIKKLYKDL